VPGTQELVKIRASQINGCGFCTDMHTKDADASGGVTDETWANAAKHYDEDQLAALVSLAFINTFNRMNVIVQQPAGDYQPGQFG
jgi:AhpD family alkylhydroperoxidase